MHVVGDVRTVIYKRWWAGVVGMPSCTNTAMSGADRFEWKRIHGLQWHGISFYGLLWCAPTNLVILEHSISVVHDFIPIDRVQRVHPYMFPGGGDARKAADLAIRGAPPIATLHESEWPTSTRNYTHEIREADRDVREVERSRTEAAMARGIASHMIAHAGSQPDPASVPSFADVRRDAAERYAAAGHPLPGEWDNPLALRRGGDEAKHTAAEGRATARGLRSRPRRTTRLRHALRPVPCPHGLAPIPCTAPWWDDALMPDGSAPCRRQACAEEAARWAAASETEVRAALSANQFLGQLTPVPEHGAVHVSWAGVFSTPISAQIDVGSADWHATHSRHRETALLMDVFERLARRRLRRDGDHSCKRARLDDVAVASHAVIAVDRAASASIRQRGRREAAATAEAAATDSFLSGAARLASVDAVEAHLAANAAAARDASEAHGEAASAGTRVLVVPANSKYGTVKLGPRQQPYTFIIPAHGKPGARRATAATTAAALLPTILPEDPSAACYVAGIVGEALLVLVPTTAEPAPAASTGAWFDREGIGKDSSTPHHRVAMCALARLQQLVGPTDSVDAEKAGLRGGVGHAVGMARSRAARAGALGMTKGARAERARSFDAALLAGNAAMRELREHLLRESERLDGHVADCLSRWVDRIVPPPAAEMPAELRQEAHAFADAGLELLPFAHRCPIHATKPLPPPAPQPPAADGFEPRHVRDVLTPGAVKSVKRKLREIALWHARRRAGTRATRPGPLALGASAFQPAARGRIWDMRQDPPKLLDTTATAFETHLGIDFLEEALEGCRDEELVSMIRYGVVIKADLPPQIVICPNLLSLYDDAGGVGIDAVTEELGELIDRGWYGATKFIPFAPWRASPRGAVPRPNGGPPRGIGDLGAPRTELLTAPEGEPVVSVNTATGCGRRQQALAGDSEPKWTPEDKPTVADAAQNASILRVPADASGQPVLVVAFDFAKYFHQLFFQPTEYWLLGAVMPKRGRDAHASDEMQCLTEHVMTMGLSPSSQVAQRLANALMRALMIRMDAAEEAWRLSGGRDDPRVEAWLAARRDLPHDDYGSQARLFNGLMYTDDPQLTVVGVQRTVRMLVCLHELCGPDMLNLMYAKEAKWQLSTGVIWQGVGIAPALGLLWVPRAKAVAAAHRIGRVLARETTAIDYRKLVGFLESLVTPTGAPRRTMDDLYGPMQPGAEVETAPNEPLPGAPARDEALREWLQRLATTPGASLLAQLAVDAPPPAAVHWRPQSDAAVGDVHPDGRAGLGGYLYGYYWHLSTLSPITIPVAEMVAAFINVIAFAPLLRHATHVTLEVDALATPSIVAAHHARSATMRAAHAEAMALEEVAEMMHALWVEHSFGENNTAADAASRLKWPVLISIAHQLGHQLQRVELPRRALDFLDRVLVRCGWGPHRAPEGGACDPAAPGGPAIRFTSAAAGRPTLRLRGCGPPAREIDEEAIAAQEAIERAHGAGSSSDPLGGGGGAGAGGAPHQLSADTAAAFDLHFALEWQTPEQRAAAARAEARAAARAEKRAADAAATTAAAKAAAERACGAGSSSNPPEGSAASAADAQQQQRSDTQAAFDLHYSLEWQAPAERAADFSIDLGQTPAERAAEAAGTLLYVDYEDGRLVKFPMRREPGRTHMTVQGPLPALVSTEIDEATGREKETFFCAVGWCECGHCDMYIWPGDCGPCCDFCWDPGCGCDCQCVCTCADDAYDSEDDAPGGGGGGALRLRGTGARASNPTTGDPAAAGGTAIRHMLFMADDSGGSAADDDDDRAAGSPAPLAAPPSLPGSPAISCCTPYPLPSRPSAGADAGGGSGAPRPSGSGSRSGHSAVAPQRPSPSSPAGWRLTLCSSPDGLEPHSKRHAADPLLAQIDHGIDSVLQDAGTPDCWALTGGFGAGGARDSGAPHRAEPPGCWALRCDDGAGTADDPDALSLSVAVPDPTERGSGVPPTVDAGAAAAAATRASAAWATEEAVRKLGPGRRNLRVQQSEKLALEMMESMRADGSRHALRPDNDEALAVSCLRLVNLLLGHVNRNTSINEASNWRHWVDFCAYMHTAPWRDDHVANSGGEGHSREVNLLALALLYIYARMRPAKRTPNKAPKPSSALAVLRGVRRIHKRMGHTMADLGLATRLAAALSDEYVLEHGPEALMAHRTEPLSNAMVEWLVNGLPSGTRLDGIADPIVDKSSLADVSRRACYATMARTGFRADEVTLRTGHEFTLKRLSRWHLRWRISGEWVYAPTAADMRALREGDFAVLIPPCSKADQFGIEWGPSPIWLRHSATEAVNAARQLAALELKYPVGADDRRTTPLFVDGAKRALSDTALRSHFKAALAAGPFDPAAVDSVSLHSFRVYLACALLELKRSHAEIQALLRWKTDEALRIYARLNCDAYADLLDGVGGVALDQARTQNLPQHSVGAHVEALRAVRNSLHAAADASDEAARQGGEDDADDEEAADDVDETEATAPAPVRAAPTPAPPARSPARSPAPAPPAGRSPRARRATAATAADMATSARGVAWGQLAHHDGR